MARTKGARNKRTREVIYKWDRYAKQYSNPVEFLFKVMNGELITVRDSDNKETQIRPTIHERMDAAVQLIPYRYSKVKPLNDDADAPSQLVLTWGQPEPAPKLEKVVNA